MKPNQLLTNFAGLIVLLVSACAGPKLAQKTIIEDDVYHTTAQAKIFKPAEVSENSPATTNDTPYDTYGRSDLNYDMDYSSRIDRFYYGNPMRGYFDPYYNFNSFNNLGWFNNSFGIYGGWGGFGLNAYYNNWFNNPYHAWGYYGSPYYNNFWGPYSYGGIWNGGFYGNGFYGNGYYGGGIVVAGNTRNPNYGARPSRGSENGIGRANGSSYYGGNEVSTRANTNTYGTNGTTVTRTRAEMYNPTGNTTSSRPASTASESRPSSSSEARPSRGNEAPTRSTYSPPPTQQSAPPASYGTGSSSNSGGSSSGGGSARPTRGGGK